MNAGVAEILGLFLVVVGCCTIVAAASLVSIALAVLGAGLFLVLGGILLAYAAAITERAAKAAKPKAGGQA